MCNFMRKVDCVTCLLRPPNIQVNDGRLEADHRRLDYRNFADDEEVTLLPHERDTDVPDNPVSDGRDGPDT